MQHVTDSYSSIKFVVALVDLDELN